MKIVLKEDLPSLATFPVFNINIDLNELGNFGDIMIVFNKNYNQIIQILSIYQIGLKGNKINIAFEQNMSGL